MIALTLLAFDQHLHPFDDSLKAHFNTSNLDPPWTNPLLISHQITTPGTSTDSFKATYPIHQRLISMIESIPAADADLVELSKMSRILRPRRLPIDGPHRATSYDSFPETPAQESARESRLPILLLPILPYQLNYLYQPYHFYHFYSLYQSNSNNQPLPLQNFHRSYQFYQIIVSLICFAMSSGTESNDQLEHMVSPFPTQTETQSTQPVPAETEDVTVADDVNESNHTSSKTKKKRNRPKKTGKKFKTPIPSSGELKTFIDHGTTCNSEGYPIYPNGDTVFVREPLDDITNFGHIAYPHTQKNHGSKDSSAWKTTWYTCLGVLHCDDDFCDYAAPPPTGEGKAAELIEDHPTCPADACNGQHLWTQCPTTSCRIDIEKASGWAVLRHLGTHNHVWPTSKKADPLAMRTLTIELVKNPKVGPLVLKVGQAGAGQTVTPPVTDIHPAFSNGGRLGYLRRKVLVEKGLMPEKESKGGGDRLIMDLMHWGSDVHINFQSEWMAEQLVQRDQFGKVYSGGLLSDVTYRFFKNGYLLTTSMYCQLMHRWIPIQLTWMWGLDVAHYRSHFVTLLNQIKSAELTYHERDLMVQQVVDFSVAQKKGFIAAYMEVFNEIDPAKALDKLKGCHEHYRQSITRVKKNRNIVDASQVAYFEKLALNLLEPDMPGGLDLGEKFDQIGRLFPKAKAWLDWWNTSDIHAMLFCARKRLPLDDPPLPGTEGEDELPDTTNGQESMHRQYYILSTTTYFAEESL
ncbi:uncharacterized protein MELLADRAFT_90616 [Melampsora larici-populina 98AG31]|uniref:GCM domain-containing protein n=1 Tax=Melampsora larici-populina (strain 98AG31 / pathotype 3-4-7) TaxID=747676 RepID=F4RXJ2_MELLP|nr:uncharacterized protein MELLADRAFT_90616 [Melampsora larici-populina 98AG31]EGG02975.1 hypothetical protein MELLADRAFT_90616 [Melampsora larici-populina 98AG31]